ncbi:triacylglycerol esterase/lipase EstA (alpha/beta hydrolase family) [Duganella sp. 3397]|uniref:esterase/lipase family protein n=1 Tax=Duganella sp. 3397 TaxID=2817732 RepID=UPI002859C4EE|nr:alpha/beta fold hydrolase [Duganella sp. 3397]MDR7050884.1 triacylglycerol esterase/lipase EstA (alpha/beta hydrolase family) [Duganella sp. 3397]
MIKRLLILLLVVEVLGVLAVAAALRSLLPPGWPAPVTVLAAVAGGVLVLLLVRMSIAANNFRISWRARSVPAVIHALDPIKAARLFLHEFASTMLTSSWHMLRPIGLQLQPQARGLPVLLIHGYGCNSGYWRPLSAHLRASGISHYGIDLEPPGADIDDFAPQVQAAVEHLCAVTGSAQVIILAHSMGGLVARAWLRRHGAARVARVITLGTPHHGTVLADLGPGRNAVQMRCGSAWLGALAASETAVDANLQRNLFCSIYSVHDNIVAPQDSSALPGARNLVFGAIGHVALGRHPEIVRCALAEIVSTQHGDFV